MFKDSAMLNFAWHMALHWVPLLPIDSPCMGALPGTTDLLVPCSIRSLFATNGNFQWMVTAYDKVREALLHQAQLIKMISEFSTWVELVFLAFRHTLECCETMYTHIKAPAIFQVEATMLSAKTGLKVCVSGIACLTSDIEETGARDLHPSNSRGH
ncbi:hypothetical protein [Sporisorium scitamineum]|uniref:Uncharacterized protein n=1 Tax=Sporisorium scitamineum TaxID=49012 RepID=A0A0F7RYR7_9BASI|nr:hypothetical protein [Sporisorium scitamineum]